MNLQSLRTFYIAARYESLTAAAEELLYAPSTVTLHIQQLEAEWGVKLFEKKGRGVKLTTDGRVILGKVKAIINQVDTLDRTVTDITEGEAGHIRIGAIEPVASCVIAPLLGEFMRDRPRLQINFETGSIYSIAERVGAGELDIGITQMPRAKSNLYFDPLYVQKHQVLMCVDDPLNDLEIIRIENLKERRIVFMERVADYDGAVFHGLVAHGSDHPYAGIEIGNTTAVIRLVRMGVGIALMPEMAVTPMPEGLVLREVEGFDFHMTIGIMLGGGKSNQLILFRFLDYIRENFRRYADVE